MLIRACRPTERTLNEILDQLSGMSVTYPELGSTRDSEMPKGYAFSTYSVLIGTDHVAFRRGQEALRRWEAHRHAGAVVRPAKSPLATGTTVIVTLHVGPVSVLAPCRIVYVTDEEDRFGFAYGTLPGHPERGEEAFHVDRALDDEVTFSIRAFSRPADALARLGHPIARAIQRRVTKAYLDGVRLYVTGSGNGGESGPSD